jgi:hypothetical protein
MIGAKRRNLSRTGSTSNIVPGERAGPPEDFHLGLHYLCAGPKSLKSRSQHRDAFSRSRAEREPRARHRAPSASPLGRPRGTSSCRAPRLAGRSLRPSTRGFIHLPSTSVGSGSRYKPRERFFRTRKRRHVRRCTGAARPEWSRSAQMLSPLSTFRTLRTQNRSTSSLTWQSASFVWATILLGTRDSREEVIPPRGGDDMARGRQTAHEPTERPPRRRMAPGNRRGLCGIHGKLRNRSDALAHVVNRGWHL